LKKERLEKEEKERIKEKLKRISMEEDIYYQEYDLTGVEDIEENIEEVSVQNLYRVEGKVLKQEEIDGILKKELADNKNKQALEIRLSESLSEKFEEVEDKSFELEEDLKKEKNTRYIYKLFH